MNLSTLKRYFPILQWLPRYRRGWLRPDLIAGLTVWMVMVPEAMAYAGIAKVPPLMGLYTVPLPLFAYAILGSSRLMVVGPDSATALISASVVGGLAAAGSVRFMALTSALAMAVGVFFLVFGLLKMGWIASFISEPVMTGFLEGIVLVTILGQVPALLGLPEASGRFFEKLWHILQSLSGAGWLVPAIGLGSLALLFALRRWASRLPGGLITVVLAIGLVSVLGLKDEGVRVVGMLGTQLPALHLPDVAPSDYLKLVPGALAIVLLGYIETLASDEGAALKGGGEADPDQELIALGAANLGTGVSGGFIAVGSLSKTSVAMSAGGKTQLAYVFTGALVLLTLRFLMPLLANLPYATLAAIVIAAMIELDQTRKLARFWHYSPLEFGLSLVALLGVLILGVLPGVGLGVILSLLVLIWRSAHPGVAVIGQMPDGCTFRDIARHPEAKIFPGLLIFRIDAQLTFPDSRYFVTSVLWEVGRARDPVKVVIIDAETINDVDITGAEALKKLHAKLAKRGIDLWLAQVKDPVFDKLRRMEVIDVIGVSHCFRSVKEAVEVFERQKINRDESNAQRGSDVHPAHQIQDQ